MKNAINKIKEMFSSGSFAFSGSFCLKGILKREIEDLDICFPIESMNRIHSIINKNNLPIKGGRRDYGDGRAVLVTEIEGIKIDIFFDFDFNESEKRLVKGGGGLLMLHPLEVVKKKLDLLLHGSSKPKKHLEDILAVCNHFNNPKNKELDPLPTEDIPF